MDMSRQSFLLVILLAILIEKGKFIEGIFGGVPVKRGDLPYMALVRQLLRGDICGGAIISTTHILTGGMCAKYHSRPFKQSIVITGTVSLTRGGETHKITHAIAHPLFHKSYPETIRYDIGVITLCRPIKFNAFQQPAYLPTRPFREGAEGTVAGWGHTETDESPDILQKLVTKVYSNKSCVKLPDYESYPEGSRICTFSGKGKGFCNFDNGSPLLVRGAVVGIASLLYGCGVGKVDQYADVRVCLRFIHEEMETGCAGSSRYRDYHQEAYNDRSLSCEECLNQCWNPFSSREQDYD